jgi:hypothetical protein
MRRVQAVDPGATQWNIQAGANTMTPFFNLKKLKSEIINLMNKYDGKKELPASSGNRKNDPLEHNWRSWLHGVQAVTYKRRSVREEKRVQVEFEREREKLQRINKKLRAKVRG